MKKPILAGISLLLYCLFSSQTAVATAAETVRFNEQSIVASRNQTYMDVDIMLENTDAFSSVEFGIKTSDSVQIHSVAFNQGITASKIGPTEKDGMYYLGFVDTKNNYSGNLHAATIRFAYTGNADATITLAQTTLTTVEGRSANKRVLESNPVIQISRAAAGDGFIIIDQEHDQDPVGEAITDDNGIRIIPQINGTVAALRLDYETILEAFSRYIGTDATSKQLITVVIDSVAENINDYRLELPTAWFQAEQSQQIHVVTSLATVTISSNMFNDQQWREVGYISLRLSQAELSDWPDAIRAAIGGRPATSIQFFIETEPVNWRNSQVSLHIAIPYLPSLSESNHPEKIIIYYIDENHEIHMVKSGRYHETLGQVTFTVDHLSSFVVGYREKSYADSIDSWARTEIEALAVRQIINGVSDLEYLPQGNITRADFVKLLVGVLDIEATGTSTVAGFTDVAAGVYYYEAVMAARASGLILGTGDNLFMPQSLISRQDMMVLLNRALSIAEYELPLAEQNFSYTDWNEVSAYAAESVARLSASGLIQGSYGQLRPLASLTRAEAARVLYLIYMRIH